jgi:hypothetical protein
MASKDAPQKNFFWWLLTKGKEFLESDHVDTFREQTKDLVNKTVNTVKKIDIDDLKKRWQATIHQGKTFVKNFDRKKATENFHRVSKNIKENPHETFDQWIEKFVGFIAKMAGMPDPKTWLWGKNPPPELVRRNLHTDTPPSGSPVSRSG